MKRTSLLMLALFLACALATTSATVEATMTQAPAIEKAQAVQNQMLNPATVAQSPTATVNTKVQYQAKVVFTKTVASATLVGGGSLKLKHAEPGVTRGLQGSKVALKQNFPNPFNGRPDKKLVATATADSATAKMLTTVSADTTARADSATVYLPRRAGLIASDLVAAGRYLGARAAPSIAANSALAIPAPSNFNVMRKAA